MNFIMKKIGLLFIAIIIAIMLFSNRSYAVSISLELSGDGIQNANGIYLCTKNIPVGGTISVKAEEVTRNEETSTGETGRKDVTSECEWKSSDENVATVSNGVIKGVSEGIAEITVTYAGSNKEFDVVVGEEIKIGFGESIGITQKDNIKTIKKGDTLQLDIVGIETLSDIKNEDVTWTSSDEKIATIDKNGLVTATGAGKVTIKAEYTSYSSTYEIDVTDNQKDDNQKDDNQKDDNQKDDNQKDDNQKDDNQKDDNQKDDNQKDDTVANKDLAKTGENNSMIILGISIAITALAYVGLKLKNKF